MIPERLGDPLRHMTVPPTIRGFLKRDDIGAKDLKFPYGHVETLFKVCSIVEEAGPGPVMQHVVRQEADRGRALLDGSRVLGCKKEEAEGEREPVRDVGRHRNGIVSACIPPYSS
jgi:hypothetical protein